MEAINTVYQNVKEDREQMQQMLELDQQELENQELFDKDEFEILLAKTKYN